MAAECNASSCDILVTEVDQHWLAQLAREHNAGHRDWRCYLHPRVDYSLDFDLDNTEVRFFAEDLVIRQMNIKADYSDLRLKFGSLQQETRIDLKGRTCDVELFLPQAAAIRLAGIYLSPDAQSVLGLTEHEGALFTDDYATAAVRFDVVADLDNSDVVVKRY
jgi:hypothetical protein